jgi:hypothetical protein
MDAACMHAPTLLQRLVPARLFIHKDAKRKVALTSLKQRLEPLRAVTGASGCLHGTAKGGREGEDQKRKRTQRLISVDSIQLIALHPYRVNWY